MSFSGSPLALRRTSARTALLAGVSGMAVSVGLTIPAQAGGARAFSPAWFAARVDASTASAAAAGTPSATLNQVAKSDANLATLASRLQAMEAAQAAASSAAASAASSVPNGLVLGGLQVAPGAAPGSPLWTGANLPTQTPTNGRAEVTVVQTAPQAMLTWQTFNVGSKTDLSFNQSAGGANASNWVVLNQVEDPAASPTQILGSITAPGKVYIIDANGILFGAGAQVNLGSLIASTAAITATQFASGIYGAASGSGFAPTFTGAAIGSSVVVDQGAQITTAAPSSVTSGGGSVLLLGDTVENNGEITTPDGQTILAAGQDFTLRQGYSSTGNQTATVQGSQIDATGGTGAVTNNGLIVSTTGDITLDGHTVTQAGIAMATTSVNTRGSVHLLNDLSDLKGTITLAPGSVTVVDPDNSSTTALDTQRQADITQSAANNLLRDTAISATNPQLGDVSTLSDRLDESRIEIVTGGTVGFESNSLTLSQGGQIAVQAERAVAVEDGSILDVSGSTGAVLPMSSNALTVNIQGNELRDAPVNRDTGLISSNNVTLDIQDLLQVPASSSDPNVRDYTEGGLLEVSGYLANIGHTIDEWAAVGGTITLASAVVLTAPQSTLNVSGGAVTVQGGELAQSYLISASGQLYNINTAPANIEYVGVYNGYTVSYARFGGTDIYTSPVAAPTQIYQDGYTYGRDAGSVVVDAYTAVLEGAFDAGVTNGVQQTGARAAGITDPYQFSQKTIALPGTLDLGGFNFAVTPYGGTAPTGTVFDAAVSITATTTPEADAIIASGVVPDSVKETYNLSANLLNSDALGGLSILTAGTIDITAPVTLAPGGTLTLQAAGVTVASSLTARGGSIVIGDNPTNPNTGAATPLFPAQGGGVLIQQGATLDLRGEWTNAALSASNLSGEALINGGNLNIDSLRALYMTAGTEIDASSGGALLAGGKEVGGTGGNVTLVANDPQYNTLTTQSRYPTVMDETLIDTGVNGGGTLTLTAPYVVVGSTSAPQIRNTVLLAVQTFQTGFHDYVINGFDGLSVLPGTVVTVAEPVYEFFGGNLGAPANAPTGEDPSQVFGVILPPTYIANRATAKLTQRQGASVAFISNNRLNQADYGGGAIDIGAGSSITVDPGQSVQVQAYGQLTDDGTITAPSGSVSLVNEQANQLDGTNTPTANTLSLSVYVGADATIDVAGQATIFTDLFGRPFGVVGSGGAVTLGSLGGSNPGDPAQQLSTDAFVLVQPGAVIDASGASATIDLLAGTTPGIALRQTTAVPTDPILLAGNGGSITVSSYSGIELDGALQALAGGAGASGGTLAMILEDPEFVAGTVVPKKLQRPHEITISQTAQSIVGGATLAPGQAVPLSAYGSADISQQQIAAGGFSNLNLFARDAFSFDGNVALGLSGSVRLSQGIITDPVQNAAVTITAPYVSLSGETAFGGQSVFYTINGTGWSANAHKTTSSFTVNADLIDVNNALRFGAGDGETLGGASVAKPTQAGDLAGFGEVSLNSSGDIRFGNSSLTTPGDVTLTAAQIYPVTGAVATIYAGYDENGKSPNPFNPSGTITVRSTGAAAQVPYSIGGSLALYAGSIIQDGVIRAPEGQITLGGIGVGPTGLRGSGTASTSFTYSVSLQQGSITSVSMDDATVPYGGTVDGVSYTYNGTNVGSFNPSVTLAGQTQSVSTGALLDMSGGGTLAGAGFITGRGGSTNVLTNPFLVFDAATGSVGIPTLSSAPVYAIVPGYASDYAPTSPVEADGSYGSVPALGSQVTIGAGVPGVAPGTYTLLPSYFALLPGAARVQINTGVYDTVPGVTALGAGSYELNATTSVANTGVQASRPVEVVVTTGAGVALNSEYDTETYSQFAVAQAAQFGTPRGRLPEDGKTLILNFPSASTGGSALSFDGTADFTAVSGYFSGQAEVGAGDNNGAKLEILADGTTPMSGYTGIDASALDALGAPSLVIGGTVQTIPALPSQLGFAATDGAVVVDSGATLTGPQIFLIAGSAGISGSAAASVTVDSGAVIKTTGSGAPPFDSSNGYYYNAAGYTVLSVSNGLLTFVPNTSPNDYSGQITIANGAALLTDGTLNFATSQGLSLGTQAIYGAKYLAFTVNNINVVSDAALAQTTGATPSLVLPSGLTLTQDLINTLLAGDPARGTPALQSLVLSASQSINFAGSVSLDTGASASGGLQQLVLNTPAIYGYGTGTDVATISTGTLYWNGVETLTSIGGGPGTPTSALPGAYVTGNTASGVLNIAAQSIILGYGPDTTPDTQTTLNRLIEGFGTVNLDATGSISGADRGTLSVYQDAATNYGQPGTGGTLNIETPVLTGAAGSVDSITAGGALTIAAPMGETAATRGALGATLNLTGQSITDSGAVLLNAGRLTMTTTTGDIDLATGSRTDLAGTSVALLDQTEYSGGGSLVLASASGNITEDAGAAIDVSAANAAAGSIQATALNGTVAFNGSIAGGSSAGQSSGAFTVSADALGTTGTLSAFDALNAALDAGSVFGTRSFEIANGDLTVDATVTAHDVSITTDAGSLTVTGTIDASGAAPGSIALNAGAGLTIATGAALDAQGTVLQTDSYGVAIESENRAIVDLTTAAGTLTLGDATINVSSPNAAALGQVILDAPRLLSNGAETGDVAISAAGPVDIIGAQSIILYGSRTYTPTDANGTIVQNTDPSIAGSVSLQQINTDNTAFMTLAASNGTLGANTAGLAGYAGYEVAPADVIQSAAGGNLTVDGDLNLALLRYGPNAGSAPGAGIAGLLTLRAANNLTVNGSITDGFATPADATTPTKDDTGWTLFSNEPLGQQVILPTDLATPVVLANGTTFLTSNVAPLNYAITIGAATITPNVVIPTNVVTAHSYKVPASGLTATATITGSNGSVIATAGQVLAPGTVIPAGSTLAAGSVVPFAVRVVGGTVWPAGASLSLFSSPTVTLKNPDQGTLTLTGGEIIPIGASLVFANGKSTAPLRATVNGQQGLIYAVADMLPSGSQSWSLNLVGGANLASANLLAVQPISALAASAAANTTDPAGSIVLSDNHYTLANKFNPTASFSVVRTGTGSLNLVAGGNVDEASLFGVYTAGTQTTLGSAAADAPFNAARALQGSGGTVLGSSYSTTYGAVIAGQQSYYPNQGGNVLVSAQADVLGDIVGNGVGANASTDGSDSIANWLWKQGGAGLGQSTSWWINFGSYVLPLGISGGVASTTPVLAGFTGIGALGGGNVTVSAGQDAGEVSPINSQEGPISQGLVIAVASTGRVVSVSGSAGTVTGGTTAITGGGLLTLDVGGTLNPGLQAGSGAAGQSNGSTLGGTLVDMRGDTIVDAGQVGRIDLLYDTSNATDPRPQDPFTTQFATSSNGLILVPGDGTVTIDALRDLVVAGAGDPGREAEQALTFVADTGVSGKQAGNYAGDTGFSLWTPGTAIDLFSAGGNLTPATAAANGVATIITNDPATDYRFVYPATLSAIAASGSLYYGQQGGDAAEAATNYSLELAPSPTGELTLLAADSIYAHGYAVDMSGADNSLSSLPNQFNPAYTDDPGSAFNAKAITNFLNAAGNFGSPDALFAFEADTPTGDLHAGDTQPARIYAASGDLVDVQFGEILNFATAANEPVTTWYLAAKPGWIMAGGDIISSGTRPSYDLPGLYATSVYSTYPNEAQAAAGSDVTSGNLLLNLNTTDISVVSAGQDILSSYFYIAGPGVLEVDAGRNINDTGNAGLDFGVMKSIGPIYDINPSSRTGGAAISVLTGAGSIGPDYTQFSALYLNPANQANLAIPLSDPANAGKVQQTYQDQLYTWLQTYFGYTGSEANQLTFFNALPAIDQDVFDRAVFYSELNASGLQEGDPASLFYKSYQRGQTAIAMLFPAQNASGMPITYNGSLTMDSGTLTIANSGNPVAATFDAGISTLYGGAIQILSPGGNDIFGTTGGPVPGASSGVITSGSGDIDIYALDNVLLGQSRIFTTFGGNILIWSAQGDINAGRGSKTTILYQPPLITYNSYGSVTLSPAAPTSGAGIATLNPIAGTVPGDVNLVAPLGTIDAGEAGIRASGNVNISALILVGTANVSAGGTKTGNAAVTTTNTAAASAAASASGSSTNAAAGSAEQHAQQQTEQPSVITVEIIGGDNDDQEQKRRRKAAA
jgi:filamentous hemagglutinin family protein